MWDEDERLIWLDVDGSEHLVQCNLCAGTVAESRSFEEAALFADDHNHEHGMSMTVRY